MEEWLDGVDGWNGWVDGGAAACQSAVRSHDFPALQRLSSARDCSADGGGGGLLSARDCSADGGGGGVGSGGDGDGGSGGNIVVGAMRFLLS